MKKFYTTLLTVIVGLVCGFSVYAQNAPITVKVVVDKEKAVEGKVGYYGTWTVLPAGEYAFNIEYEYGYDAIYLRAIEPYQIVTCVCDDPYENISNGGFSTTYNIYPQASWLDEGKPRVYNVTTQNKDDLRTGSMTVNVTGNPAAFTVARNGGEEFNLSEGANTVKFDPENETPITFKGVKLPMYKFTMDGDNLVPDDNRQYRVNPSNGSVIDIVTDWPEKKVSFTITIPEEAAGALKKLESVDPQTWSYTPVEFKVNEAFEIDCAQNLRMEFDQEDYIVNSVTVNDKKLYSASSTFFVGEDDVNVVIDAQVRERLKFFIETARDGEAEYATDMYASEWKPLKAGSTEITPTESYYGYNGVYVRPCKNFKMVSLKCEDPVDEITLPTDPTQSVKLFPTDSWKGRVYKLDMISLDDLRPNTFTVNVTGSSSVILARRADNSAIDLETGANTVRFADEEMPLRFSYAGSVIPLYSVKHNGTPVECKEDNVYEVTVAQDDVVDVQGEWPEGNTSVVITYPETAAGVVSGISYGSWPNAVDITGIESGVPVEIPHGTRITVKFDTGTYKVDNVTVNGVETSFTSIVEAFVGMEPVEIDVQAHPYGKVHYTLNFNDYEHVTLREGKSWNSPVELTSNTYSGELDERESSIYITPAADYYIASVTDETGKTYDLDSYGTVQTHDGMVLDVVVSKIVYDGKFTVWVEDMEDVADTYDGSKKNVYYFKSGNWDYIYLPESGYNVVEFSKGENPQFSLSITLKWNNAHGYQNETQLPYGWSGASKYFDARNLAVADGDVIRLYTKGVLPELRDVTFELVGDAAAELAASIVTTDLFRTRENWTEGLQLLDKTLVSLTLPEGIEGVKVKLDDEALTPDENGNYSFVVSAPHKVVLSSATGLTDLEGDNADNTVTVYNLQGIKLIDKGEKADLKQLPAGIYIVNGEKKVIR